MRARSKEVPMSYWWCLTHRRVEPDEGCAHAERLGPYDTREDAASALERAHERTEAWDKQDEEYGSQGEQ